MFKSFPLEKRIEEYKLFNDRCEINRIPVILEPSSSCTLKLKDKCKYSVYTGMTIGQLEKELYSETVYFYLDNVYVPENVNVKKLYDKYVDEDGFLYLKYSNNYTFGKFISNWISNVSWRELV